MSILNQKVRFAILVEKPNFIKYLWIFKNKQRKEKKKEKMNKKIIWIFIKLTKNIFPTNLEIQHTATPVLPTTKNNKIVFTVMKYRLKHEKFIKLYHSFFLKAHFVFNTYRTKAVVLLQRISIESKLLNHWFT